MNDFYSISAFETGECSIKCQVHYNAAHEIFKGHFPGNPIVPGVCTMALVKELLEKVLEQRLLLKESKAVKFLGLINPLMSPTISLSWKGEDSQIYATVSLQEGTTSLFKMSALYNVANP